MPAASPELRILVAPRAAYAAWAHAPLRASAAIAARRPLFVVLLQGVTISIAADGTVTAPAVASVAACWSFTVAIQVLAGTVLILAAPRRSVPLGPALDLLFAGHAPWSLWLLAWAAAFSLGVPSGGFPWLALLTGVVPAALTARSVAAFGETVLGGTRREAVVRAAAHQCVVWLAIAAFAAAAVQMWPRLLGALA